MKVMHASLIAATALIVAGCQGRISEPGITASHDGEIRFMREYGSALAPLGYVSFCQREPGECASPASGVAREARVTRVAMTPERWLALNKVNTIVNRSVRPATDEEVYARPEHWALPLGAGDCEDYVLQKRKLLLAEGWPASALLITVVRDEDRLGHAVLTVASDMGDLVLDNKSDLIRPWADTGYVYYKRQSRSDPQRWVALTPNAQSGSALAALEALRTTRAPGNALSARDPAIPPH